MGQIRSKEAAILMRYEELLDMGIFSRNEVANL